MSSSTGRIGRSAWHFQTTAPSAPTASTSSNLGAPVAHPTVATEYQPGESSVSGAALKTEECLPKTCVAPGVRSLFSFDYFNKMQSKCFPVLYDSWDNSVIGAPTAAGKTVCFELAIASYLNLKHDPRSTPSQDTNTSSSISSISAATQPPHTATIRKTILYLAPLKSLVQERLKDWKRKLQPLGVECQELTGDKAIGEDLQLTQKFQNVVYLSTPERWDAITRKWKDNAEVLDRIGLIMIDEVHLLGDDRGAVLESIVTRALIMSRDIPPRIIALSASTRNVSDIGRWLRAPQDAIFYFGEEHRPITPKLHVVGYPPSKNDFFFDRILDSKLWGVISQYSEGKPTLVFASSRKSTVTASSRLVEACSQNSFSYVKNESQKNRLFEAARKVSDDPQLAACVLNGIGYHHAGMSPENRHLVETLFSTGEDIMVVVATSTLAVGVNLPAYLVVIKSTSYWTQSNGVEECNPLQIRQMIGRAGRPQFGDSSAAAVIMTQQSKVATYQSILECDTAATESNMHKHLTNILLAEIDLGSIASLKDALNYLQHTFLAVRIHANTSHYMPQNAIQNSNANPAAQSAPQGTPTIASNQPSALNRVPAILNRSDTVQQDGAQNSGKNGQAQSASSALVTNPNPNNKSLHPLLRAMCMGALSALSKHDCIWIDKSDLFVTELGRCMVRYFVAFESIQAIVSAFPPKSDASTPSKDQNTSQFSEKTSNGSHPIVVGGNIATKDLLEVICASPQFSDTLVRRAEKKELREVSAKTRFPLKAKGIFKTEKVMILVQAPLIPSIGGNKSAQQPFTDVSLCAESENCLQTAISLCFCLIQFFIDRKWFYALHKAILMLKSLRKKCWTNDGPQTQQIPMITREMASQLSNAGIKTLVDMSTQSPEKIAQILRQKIIFAQNAMMRLAQIPSYSLTINLSIERTSSSSNNGQGRTEAKISKILKFTAQPLNWSRFGSDKSDFRYLALGHSGKLIAYRILSLKANSSESATFHVSLPDDFNSTASESHSGKTSQQMEGYITANDELEIFFASDEWIGFDLLGTISLSTLDFQTFLPENQFQDPYGDTDLTLAAKNPKKRKRNVEIFEISKAAPSSSRAPNTTILNREVQHCNHKCKNKFICKHECCKTHPEVKNIGTTQFEVTRPIQSTLGASHINIEPSNQNSPLGSASSSTNSASRGQTKKTISSNTTERAAPSTPKRPIDIVRKADNLLNSIRADSTALGTSIREPKSTIFKTTLSLATTKDPQPTTNMDPPSTNPPYRISHVLPTAESRISVSHERPSHAPPPPPIARSPSPPSSNYSSISTSTQDTPTGIVTTRPGKTGSFLPTFNSGASSALVNPNANISSSTLPQRPSNPKFVPPTLKPTARNASEINHQKNFAPSAATPSSFALSQQQHLRNDALGTIASPTPIRPARRSILTPFQNTDPAPLNEPISRTSAAVNAAPTSKPPPPRAAGWEALLNWELEMGAFPEP